jgi:outer membrane biosynthesis protein TonB
LFIATEYLKSFSTIFIFKGEKLEMKFDKPEISGLLVLFIGVGLLAFTFLNAYWLLSEDIAIVGTHDLVGAFGEALAPLIATVIHVMYLGIMGWIGSLLTLRGIPLLIHPKTAITQPAQAPAIRPTPQVAEAKPAAVKKEEKPKQEKIEKPQPPEKPEAKPKEEPQKEPEKKPDTGITIEVRPPEEATVTPPKPSQPQPQQPQSQPQQ